MQMRQNQAPTASEVTSDEMISSMNLARFPQTVIDEAIASIRQREAQKIEEHQAKLAELNSGLEDVMKETEKHRAALESTVNVAEARYQACLEIVEKWQQKVAEEKAARRAEVAANPVTIQDLLAQRLINHFDNAIVLTIDELAESTYSSSYYLNRPRIHATIINNLLPSIADVALFPNASPEDALKKRVLLAQRIFPHALESREAVRKLRDALGSESTFGEILEAINKVMGQLSSLNASGPQRNYLSMWKFVLKDKKLNWDYSLRYYDRLKYDDISTEPGEEVYFRDKEKMGAIIEGIIQSLLYAESGAELARAKKDLEVAGDALNDAIKTRDRSQIVLRNAGLNHATAIKKLEYEHQEVLASPELEEWQDPFPPQLAGLNEFQHVSEQISVQLELATLQGEVKEDVSNVFGFSLSNLRWLAYNYEHKKWRSKIQYHPIRKQDTEQYTEGFYRKSSLNRHIDSRVDEATGEWAKRILKSIEATLSCFQSGQKKVKSGLGHTPVDVHSIAEGVMLVEIANVTSRKIREIVEFVDERATAQPTETEEDPHASAFRDLEVYIAAKRELQKKTLGTDELSESIQLAASEAGIPTF